MDASGYFAERLARSRLRTLEHIHVWMLMLVVILTIHYDKPFFKNHLKS
jgi:hypothetical protein